MGVTEPCERSLSSVGSACLAALDVSTYLVDLGLPKLLPREKQDQYICSSLDSSIITVSELKARNMRGASSRVYVIYDLRLESCIE